MQTNQIDLILDTAYHAAAVVAADQIRRHLRPFNLKRHPLGYDHYLTLGGRRYWEIITAGDLHDRIHEAGHFAESLPDEVQARLKDHL